MKIAIAGHIDHGKSTLIGRLLLDTKSLPKGKMKELERISRKLGKDAELAYLVDQLKEEREEDRTIDTTQSFFKTRKRNYAIIDVPGHVEFIKNMITGVTDADSVVLLADAKIGIEEQTRRHAYIVNMLGLGSDIVVVNKMDLIGYDVNRFCALKEELLKLIESTGSKTPCVVPISAKDGENITKKSRLMRWHNGPCLTEALDSLKAVTDDTKKPLRFAVQDIYNVDEESVAVGKVLSGQIAKGLKVSLSPSLKTGRIKAIKIFGGELSKAEAGENVGIVLDNIQLTERGVVISDEKYPPRHTNRFSADVFWMSDRPLKPGGRLMLRCSTQETECVVENIEQRINSSTFETTKDTAQGLRLNEAGIVIFKTEKPIVLEKFDFIKELGRFVLESGGEVLGAGIASGGAFDNTK